MVNHFQDDPNPPPFIKALAEVRLKGGAISTFRPSRLQ